VLVDEGFLFAVYVRDVTDQLQAHQELLKTEEHVRQLQRIEAVGRLAGGIAHDFNNLLTAILGYSQQLAVSIGADSPLRPNVDEIHRAGERAATLTRQLLAFSRKQTLEPRLLDVNDVIRGMTSLLRSLLGEETELREELMAEPAPVQADRGQLEQIVLNLAVNARDAMPGGGVLTLRTERLDVAPDEPLPDAHVAAGRYVLLQVIDTGIGMDRETQEHAFDPYFSTKEEGRGTGLGLSMVYGFVKQSGGYVYLSSAPSAGTTFRVYFPYIEGAAVAPEEQARPGDHGRRRIETILVAEDNSQVLGLLCTVLQAAGYRVLQAGNGKEALDKATAHDGPIHALVTDLVMPGMSGRELARKVRELRPDTRVLFVSGYAGDELGDRVEPGEALLLKPFNPQELTRRIDELLAGAAGGA
jgi:nitrogen-specific signal transduction histidine kinase